MAELGRRETKKRDKHDRIWAAARELFSKRPYDQVTTAQLVEAAGVTTGTFYRYAGSKSDLFLAYMTDQFRHVADETADTAQPEAASHDPAALVVEKIFTVLGPYATLVAERPEAAVVYHREALFGDSPRELRSSAVAGVQRLEPKFAAALREFRDDSPDAVNPTLDPDTVARALYAMLYMDFLKVTVGAESGANIANRFRTSIEFCVAELVLNPQPEQSPRG